MLKLTNDQKQEYKNLQYYLPSYNKLNFVVGNFSKLKNIINTYMILLNSYDIVYNSEIDQILTILREQMATQLT